MRWSAMSCLLLALLAMRSVAQEPLTVPESTRFEATSTHDQVVTFVRELASHAHADRLATTSLGVTEEERDLVAVIAADPPCATVEAARASGKLRVLVNANIHAGEVEGKEAVQMLLREIASGQHGALLEGAVVVFVPDFNPDGNDRISTEHRPTQNGPVQGVGTRANASGLDLNRDFIKAESASVRAMLAAFDRFDPHVFMDLHTTNGSHHGYHLTYSPSLAVNADPELDRFARQTWIPEVRGQMAEKHEFRVYDYGNFPWRGGEKSWSTYDHRPRFGTNYYGLRNRLSMLSEAYSYVDYETRIAVTRAFVLETVRAAVAHADRIVALCEAADRRVTAGEDRDAWFRFGSELEPAWTGEILVGSVRRDGTRVIAEPEYEAQEMPVRIAFRGTRAIRFPGAWCVVDPSDEVVATLRRHGLELGRTTREVELRGEVFRPTEVDRSKREFQQHFEVTLQGVWQRERVTLPAGTLIVPAAQRLARVAAQLLEAQSEDSLATWNYFDGRIPELGGAGDLAYPVVRVGELPAEDAWQREPPR